LSKALAEYMDQKKRGIQISPQQTPWLLEETVQPDQAGPLHPTRREFDPTGVKVEHPTDRGD
jgi:hypothetical protein